MPDEIQISWSALKTHEHCRQKQHLSWRHRTDGQDVRNFVHGNIVDRVMRRTLESDRYERGMMVAMLPEIFDVYTTPQRLGGMAEGVVRWRSGNDRATVYNFCRELLERLEPLLEEYVLPFDYHPELTFKVPVSVPYLDGTQATVRLAGRMDLVIRLAPGRYRIIDLKGTKNPQYVKETMGQGVFYDIAWLHYSDDHVSPEEFFFMQPMVEGEPMVRLTVTDEERRVMMARIIKMAHYKWANDNAPKTDNKGCSRCEVKHACVKFEPATNAAGKKTLSLG